LYETPDLFSPTRDRRREGSYKKHKEFLKKKSDLDGTRKKIIFKRRRDISTSSRNKSNKGKRTKKKERLRVKENNLVRYCP
jgi:hypothetical protein